MRERAQQDGFGLPELMEGWTWASLVGVEEDEWLEFPELDDLVASAALDAAAASLGFAVMDSDSVYLVGADPSGVRFHLVVNEEAFDDEPPAQQVDEAAAWARDHAWLDPAPNELRDVLQRRYVFAEDGLDVVFARTLLPPGVERSSTTPEREDKLLEAEQAARIASLDEVADLSPESERWYAPIRGFRDHKGRDVVAPGRGGRVPARNCVISIPERRAGPDAGPVLRGSSRP